MDGQWSSRSIVWLSKKIGRQPVFSMCHSCPDEDESDKAAGSKKRTKSSEPDQRTDLPQPKQSKCHHAICIHGRRHRECNECGGAGICEHGRRRQRCKECHENSYSGCTVSRKYDPPYCTCIRSKSFSNTSSAFGICFIARATKGTKRKTIRSGKDFSIDELWPKRFGV